MKINEFAKEVHQNAVEHGWWDEERSFGEIIALCHSELSEALEEFRAGRPMVYCICRASDGCPCDRDGCGDWDAGSGTCEMGAMDDKPEGIAVELADCIIRILDLMGKEGISPEDYLKKDIVDNAMLAFDMPSTICKGNLGDMVAELHLYLSLAYRNWLNGAGYYSIVTRMALAIWRIQEWAQEVGVDMETILRTKHEYNKTRPYRHGGKAL